MALESIGGQFKGLDMKQLIGAPLEATADASINLARSTANFINTVGFQEDGSTRNTSFKYNKKDVDDDGNVVDQEMSIDVPLLAIVPIPNLQVDEVNVLFDMEVKSSESHEDSSDKSGSLKGTGKLGFGPFSVKATVSGSISSHSANTRKSDNSAKYHVDVRATNHGTPEGLSRVLDILAASVSPSLVKANAVDETGKPLTGTSKARYDKMKVLTADISRLEKNALLLGSNYADAIHFCKTKANDYITKFELDFESIDKTGKTKDEKDALITAENEAVESFRGFSSIIEKKISIQYMNTADFAADKVADDVKNILSTLKYFENGTTTQGTSNNLPDLSIALEKAIQSFISTNANQNQISTKRDELDALRLSH